MTDDTQDKGNAGEPQRPAASGNKWMIPLIIAALALVLILLAIWFFFFRDTRPHVWAEATVPYTVDACEEEGACPELNIPASGHGAHGDENLMLFAYNPEIDDPIAQWGDCLDQVLACVQEGTAEEIDDEARAPLIDGCVEAANLCPAECREEYVSRASAGSFEAAERAFFSVFVEERGYCVPREAD